MKFEDRKPRPEGRREAERLKDGSRIAVVGGGPAGSMFAFFVLETATRTGIDLSVDLYEPRDFSTAGPAGCNMCGGIVSESLIELLATEGIVLPPQVVQRGIDSYVLHTDAGKVRIDTPVEEKRIAVVHRGAGPKGPTDVLDSQWNSFDEYLLTLAVGRGARLLRRRVKSVRWVDGRPEIEQTENGWRSYDLMAIATGVNSTLGRQRSVIGQSTKPPATTRAGIREYYLGKEQIGGLFGSSVHMFLVNIPRLEFGAIIPKGEFACVCLLGKDIDQDLMNSFVDSQAAKSVMPFARTISDSGCRCMPKMATGGATRPYGNRLVLIGDAGTTRLYKDGIGAAYKTAKAAATTAVLRDVSAEAFRKYYQPVCKTLNNDNRYGRVVFLVASVIRHLRFAQRSVLQLVQKEQARDGSQRYMSMVLWDMFTGSASYKDIFFRTLRPAFLTGLIRSILGACFVSKRAASELAKQAYERQQ